jgi:MraZ protein
VVDCGEYKKYENGACLFIYLLKIMFIGEYSHNLDDKGRVAIPKKFQKDLATGAVVTRGLDQCLFLYTRDEWEKLAQKLANLPFAQANTRAFSRLMLAGAMDLEVDKQGRICVPEYLRTFAGIKKNVVIAGLYNRLEIWDAQEWSEYTKRNEQESTNIAEQMGMLGV